MDPAVTRYADWKAPADDGERLIWPEPSRLLSDTLENARRLSGANSTRIQNVPLSKVRAALRKSIGHADDARPLIATGHQTELYHAGVWVKNVLIDCVAQKLGGSAFHVAVDTDEPKHLLLRWPGGSESLTDRPANASWSGLLDAPTPSYVARLKQTIDVVSSAWGFEPVVGRFLDALHRRSLEDEPKLATAITESQQSLDFELGLRHQALVFSSACFSEAYLVFVHHILAHAGTFADDYNAALESYRREQKIKAAGRPMPNLNLSDDDCEVPFWLDELSTGTRFRAAVVRMGDRWAIRAPSSTDDIFQFDPASDGWHAASRLLEWLRRNDLRLSPRALTLTILLRILLADQFVHGIGGGRYDQVADRLISRHFKLEPPSFAVTTATLYFPGAAGRSRACMTCVMQEGHRLRHNLLGDREKRRFVDAIAAAPRRSAERAGLFSEMHGQLNAAVARRHPDLVNWEARRDETQSRVQEERVVFDRELFYAMQPQERLAKLIDDYRGAFG